ncbi:Receptor expression-enhancing protein 2 [Operophtera brumata]|uniref:Receptor expression-enhancing protein n=1 Tax=Operophtera brumata TaxID=104452 RepID=A0A0L7LI82_OPEBR|nr:Receptor expression-enhancing protein 2 [Operophtera brumata]
MEAGRACGYRDDKPRVPALSLGLSSVRLIVNQLELQHTRVSSDDQKRLSKYDPTIGGYNDFSLDQSRGRVFETLGFYLSGWIPSVSFGNFGVLAVTTGLFAPKMLSYLVVYPFCRLIFGTLYPAYASYKAVRTKNLKEYVKWMMYWIVFALFTCMETFTDVFLSWFPFYYEVKIVLVLWLLSPATKGSSILYRKFEIDEYIAKAKDQGYHTVLNLGTKGVNYATTVIMQTAIKNFNLPSTEPEGVAREILPRDVTDGPRSEEMEYQQFEQDHLPGIIEIVELDSENDPLLGHGDSIDPDYEPEPSSARARGNVARKKKAAKEKRPRSNSRGRRTRSQNKPEIHVD